MMLILAVVAPVLPPPAPFITVESIRDLTSLASALLAGLGIVGGGAVAMWRKIQEGNKSLKESADVIASKADTAAVKAIETAATTAFVADKISSDSNELKTIVQQQGAVIDDHTKEFGEFKADSIQFRADTKASLTDLSGDLKKMQEGFSADMRLVQKSLVDVLGKMAGLHDR